MTVNKLTSPISQNDLINKTNEIIDNLGGGGATDVQINGTSITSGGVANIVTNTAYNASSNKIATMDDLTDFVQKNGGSSTQTISLTSGTGTTALGIKSMSTSSYMSLSGTNGWLGSYGVSSNKRAVFYNGTGYTLAYTSEIPTVEQTYNASSTNAQSGTAVAEALSNKTLVTIRRWSTT